jgi:glycosyltransferase involved in cell wall biosynthesis
LSADYIGYQITWEKLQEKSWTLGYLLRRLGQWYYGSEWNAFVPVLDEWRISRQIRSLSGHHIIHFLWAEFATPRQPGLFRKKGARLVGTFHCSTRRMRSVLGRYNLFHVFDQLTIVSESQRACLNEFGVVDSRIQYTPLGVDTDWFHPAADRRNDVSAPLRAIMVGRTERDHGFLAEILRKIPAKQFTMHIATAPEYFAYYDGLAHVRLLPFISDAELLHMYQHADLLIMPMLDCTANDAMLESMACGTPVMTNPVGGVPEYVSRDCNYVLEHKSATEWTDCIMDLVQNRTQLFTLREKVRAWAERFRWERVARYYIHTYNAAFSQSVCFFDS